MTGEKEKDTEGTEAFEPSVYTNLKSEKETTEVEGETPESGPSRRELLARFIDEAKTQQELHPDSTTWKYSQKEKPRRTGLDSDVTTTQVEYQDDTLKISYRHDRNYNSYGHHRGGKSSDKGVAYYDWLEIKPTNGQEVSLSPGMIRVGGEEVTDLDEIKKMQTYIKDTLKSVLPETPTT